MSGTSCWKNRAGGKSPRELGPITALQLRQLHSRGRWRWKTPSGGSQYAEVEFTL